MFFLYGYTASGATVTLQPVSDTAEGSVAMVTVVLTLPAGGSAIPINVTLSGTDGDARMFSANGMLYHFIVSIVRSCW